VSLRIRLRNERPTARAPALLPQAVQLINRGIAPQPALHEQTTHNRAGAADTGTAVHIHGPARAHGVGDVLEDLDHLRPRARRAVILDRLARVLHVERQERVVPEQLRRLGQVNKALDARRQQLFQPILGLVTRGAVGMLAREQQPGYDPIAIP
jgi:hypothetical protein